MSQNLTQFKPKSHPRHLVGKRTDQLRHRQRHQQQQPGEQRFPIQVVTGQSNIKQIFLHIFYFYM